MENWGVHRRVTYIAQPVENKNQLLSGIPKEEDEDLQDQDEDSLKTETLFLPEFKKRKRRSRSQLREMKAELSGNQAQTSSKPKTKKGDCRDRWSTER